MEHWHLREGIMFHLNSQICCCGNPRREGQRYCKDCHASYMRLWRHYHPPNEEQRKKNNCVSYANVYLRRGKIQRQPCATCGDPTSQMHHPDYDKPLLVVWLCRKCHLQLHAEKRSKRHQ